jgi:hypothetical protein
MKNSKKIADIRMKITEIRGEIQDVINDDNIWTGSLFPSVGALTCVLQSLSHSIDEMLMLQSIIL